MKNFLLKSLLALAAIASSGCGSPCAGARLVRCEGVPETSMVLCYEREERGGGGGGGGGEERAEV